MRILRIIPSLDANNGGPIEAAKQIDSFLAGMGFNIEVVTLDDPFSTSGSEDYPALVHQLGPGKFKYRYSSKLIPWLKQNQNRFDAVLVNGLWQFHGFAAWSVFSKSKIPYFVFTHGMLDPWFKYKYPFKHLKKWLYWPWAEYRLLRDARAVLFTSDEERQQARLSFWLYRAKEIVTAYGTKSPPTDVNGLLASGFRSTYPETHGKRILLYLSRIHEKKGCDQLIEAFAKLSSSDPCLHLVMAGPDQSDWVKTLKQQAKRLGIADRITWPGMLRDDAKWGAFHAAEVFCLPSHQENFGIVVAEALGCGKPVLISDKVNIWREVEADGAGIVRPDTVDGTVDALRIWLTMTPEAQQLMRTASRQCFENRYQIKRVAADLFEIITKHVEAINYDTLNGFKR